MNDGQLADIVWQRFFFVRRTRNTDDWICLIGLHNFLQINVGKKIVFQNVKLEVLIMEWYLVWTVQTNSNCQIFSWTSNQIQIFIQLIEANILIRSLQILAFPPRGVMAASLKRTGESEAGTQKKERGTLSLSPISVRRLGANVAWSSVPYTLQRRHFQTITNLNEYRCIHCNASMIFLWSC